MDDGVAIEVIHCRHDSVLEFLFGSNTDVAQDRAGQLGEEALDQVQPGPCLGVKVNANRPGGRVTSQAFVSLEM